MVPVPVMVPVRIMVSPITIYSPLPSLMLPPILEVLVAFILRINKLRTGRHGSVTWNG